MADRLPPYMGTKPSPAAASPAVAKKTGGGGGGSKAFNAAFRAARNAGKKTFSFGGKSYTTELAKTKPAASPLSNWRLPEGTKGPAKPLVTLNRQGQNVPAMGRDASGKRVPATKEPAGAEKGRTYFDRPKPSAARIAEAKAYLDRSPSARAKKNAELRSNANTALNVAGAIPLVGPAIKGIQGLRAAAVIGSGIRGAMAAGRAAAPAAAATVVKKAAPAAAVAGGTKSAPGILASVPKASSKAPLLGGTASRGASAGKTVAEQSRNITAVASARAPAKVLTGKTALRTSTSKSLDIPRPPVRLPPVQKAVLKTPEPAITHVGRSKSLPETQAILRANTTKAAAKRNPELAAASKKELHDVSAYYGRNRPGRSLSPVQTIAAAKARGDAVAPAVSQAARRQLGRPDNVVSIKAGLRTSGANPVGARQPVVSKLDSVRQAAQAAGRNMERTARTAKKAT